MLKRRSGFTVIELLTVIAIIGVLAAFLFPVITSTKENAKKTQCISNMNQIWAALKSFQQNEGRYPDFIAGPQNPNGSPELKDVTGVVNGRAVSLYPEYIKSVNILVCPVAIRNGTRREFTSIQTVDDPMFRNVSGLRGAGDGGKPYQVYLNSTYDTQVPRNVPGTQNEVHYSLVWQDPPPGTTAAQWVQAHPDFVRQLRWKIPPEDTVVTWCSYHREISSGVVQPGSMDLVLFLDGHVKPLPTSRIYRRDDGSSAGQPDPNTQYWYNVWMFARE